MSPKTSLRLAAALVLPALALGACSSKPDLPPVEEQQSQEEAASETTTVPDITVTEDELEEPEDTDEVEADFPHPWTVGPVEETTVGDSDNAPIITNMRAATHDGFDRLVIDFKGGNLRGWDVAWVEQAVEQGRGEDLVIEGPALLDIRAKGTSIPVTDADYEEYFGDRSAPSAGGIRSVYDSSFEGTTHVVIGADSERPFRVFQLSDPTRLVIDVQN